jgi:hypothetical protein
MRRWRAFGKVMDAPAQSTPGAAIAQSGEVETGSPQDCATNRRIEGPIRFNVIGSDSCAFSSAAWTLRGRAKTLASA